jgi:hypothetical protein
MGYFTNDTEEVKKLQEIYESQISEGYLTAAQSMNKS